MKEVETALWRVYHVVIFVLISKIKTDLAGILTAVR